MADSPRFTKRIWYGLAIGMGTGNIAAPIVTIPLAILNWEQFVGEFSERDLEEI